MLYLDKLEEYIDKRNLAWISKIDQTVENPFPWSHYCNNKKINDRNTRLMIDADNKIIDIYGEKAYTERLYNILAYIHCPDRDWMAKATDGKNYFDMKDYNKHLESFKWYDDNHKNIKTRYSSAVNRNRRNGDTRADMFRKLVFETAPLMAEWLVNNDELDIHGEIAHDQLDAYISTRQFYGIGAFMAYQLTSSLYFVGLLINEVPQYVEYCAAGTGQGFLLITEKWEYNKELIDLIIELNSKHTYGYEELDNMAPTDACNVLCEFKKFMSGRSRHRNQF